MSEKKYEPKLDELAGLGTQADELLKGQNYFAAAFFVDNLPSNYDKSALYAGLAMRIAKEMDSAKFKENSSAEKLASQILSYCTNKSGSYSK